MSQQVLNDRKASAELRESQPSKIANEIRLCFELDLDDIEMEDFGNEDCDDYSPNAKHTHAQGLVTELIAEPVAERVSSVAEPVAKPVTKDVSSVAEDKSGNITPRHNPVNSSHGSEIEETLRAGDPDSGELIAQDASVRVDNGDESAARVSNLEIDLVSDSEESRSQEKDTATVDHSVTNLVSDSKESGSKGEDG